VRGAAAAGLGVAVGLVCMGVAVRFVVVGAVFAVGVIVMAFMSVRFVAVAAAVAVGMSGLVSVCFGTMTTTFAMLMSVFMFVFVSLSLSLSGRRVVVSAACAMPVAASVVIGVLVGVAFVPMGTGFGLFRAVRFGEGVVRHGWLPGSICGLVNTLKPLQGQGHNPGGSMKIGELAKIAHCTTETIRFYEKEGLLPEAERTEANYRSYSARHVERLRFIRNCRALDMTHDEIRALLRLTDAPADGCGSINALIDEHIAHVDTRIDELKQLKVQLTTLREQCHGEQAVEDCGIVQGLNEMDVSATRVRHTHLG
jgi:Cd(II)/Pb(II)-responsive transcriptional regulator